MRAVTNIIQLYILGNREEAVRSARAAFTEMKTPQAKQELFTFMNYLAIPVPQAADHVDRFEAFLDRYRTVPLERP